MQQILTVLVQCALGSPSHQQQVERQSAILIILAGEAQQLPYAFLIFLEDFAIHLPS
jgi:hypothetical protein